MCVKFFLILCFICFCKWAGKEYIWQEIG
jgi:hypothetical protein